MTKDFIIMHNKSEEKVEGTLDFVVEEDLKHYSINDIEILAKVQTNINELTEMVPYHLINMGYDPKEGIVHTRRKKIRNERNIRYQKINSDAGERFKNSTLIIGPINKEDSEKLIKSIEKDFDVKYQFSIKYK